MGTFDETAVARFYHRDVVGHHRKQTLTFDDDVAHRLATDHRATPIRSMTSRTSARRKTGLRSGSCSRERRIRIQRKWGMQAPGIRLGDLFLPLRDGKISEFWLRADIGFDYRADD
jgi:hypothetical protein